MFISLSGSSVLIFLMAQQIDAISLLHCIHTTHVRGNSSNSIIETSLYFTIDVRKTALRLRKIFTVNSHPLKTLFC